jgi:hypothetical protein
MFTELVVQAGLETMVKLIHSSPKGTLWWHQAWSKYFNNPKTQGSVLLLWHWLTSQALLKIQQISIGDGVKVDQLLKVTKKARRRNNLARTRSWTPLEDVKEVQKLSVSKTWSLKWRQSVKLPKKKVLKNSNQRKSLRYLLTVLHK